jgi:hypothetical protein
MWAGCGVGMKRSGMTWPHIARTQVRSALPSRLLAAKRKQSFYVQYGHTPFLFLSLIPFWIFCYNHAFKIFRFVNIFYNKV